VFSLKVDRQLSREYFTSDAIYNGSAGMTLRYEGLGIVFCQATYMWMVRLMLGALHPVPLTPANGCIFLQTALKKVNHS
jgi:hypothetical protein